MSKIDDPTRLHHMLDASKEAIAHAYGKNRDVLDSDRLLTLALIRLIEIVCEAASKVSIDAHLSSAIAAGISKSAIASTPKYCKVNAPNMANKSLQLYLSS